MTDEQRMRCRELEVDADKLVAKINETVAEPSSRPATLDAFLDRHAESSADVKPPTDRYTEWAELYPKPIPAIETARTRDLFHGALQSVDFPTLMDATRQHAASMRTKEAKFIAEPWNWLRYHRWTDYPTAEKAVDALVAELGVAGAADHLGVAYNLPGRIYEIEDRAARAAAVAEFDSEWLGRYRGKLAERLTG